MFFIQPFVRVLFRALFAKKIKERSEKHAGAAANNEEPDRPIDETEVIADVWKRIDEISEQLAHEHRQRKRLQQKIEQ
jgi:hypothetical protein